MTGQVAALTLDDVATWRDLLEWAWTSLHAASPWLAPLLWGLLVVAVVVLWIKGNGWQKVKAIVGWMQKAVRGVDQLIKLADDMEYVKGQLQNNGGSTVKDSAQKSERMLAEMQTTVASIDRTVKRAVKSALEAKTTAAATQQLLIEHISKTTT